MKLKNTLLICILSIIAFSCKEDVKYDNKINLEQFILSSTNIKVNDSNEKAVIIILQNEDCICTEENILFTKQIVESNKYKDYEKILIVSGKNHKVIKRLATSKINKLHILVNDKNKLLHAGYIATTDRIIIYSEGSADYYYDMHLTKPSTFKSKLL